MPKPLKPLKYDTSRPPADVRFKDFGILDAGSQSKASVASAIVLNGLALAFVIAAGYAAKTTIEETHQVTMLTAPVLLQPAPLPKPLPRPPLPKPPVIKYVASARTGSGPGSGGLGLIMMRERASQLNGEFEFESAPGRGTTIRVTIPFR